VDVAAGKELPDQTVVLHGDRILSIAAFDSSNKQQGRVIGARGNFLIPGLTPPAALQSGTLRPAEFLGRTEELGVIAPGRRADLVLLSADPLADIHNTTKIHAVWLHGKYFGRAALDAILETAKHRSGKGKLH
jgi:imidazolonepropionase-like amidohydrolase